MSASLVGSEMCIRDSIYAGPVLGRWMRARRRARAAAHPSLAIPHHPPPVSYTHLTLPTICSV
eukprot:14182327-Alexandrium_andersonii.AAC.1